MFKKCRAKKGTDHSVPNPHADNRSHRRCSGPSGLSPFLRYLNKRRKHPCACSHSPEWAFIADEVHGTASKDEVFIEYAVPGMGGGFARPEVRHYVLNHDKLERTDPVALTPRQFAGFWLSHPWSEVSRWTERSSWSQLQPWLEHNKGPYAEFDEPVHHCRHQPDLWQLTTHTGENFERDVYLLIRWRPPDRFTMVAISDKPSIDCTERDPEADQPRSLFQPQ